MNERKMRIAGNGKVVMALAIFLLLSIFILDFVLEAVVFQPDMRLSENCDRVVVLTVDEGMHPPVKPDEFAAQEFEFVLYDFEFFISQPTLYLPNYYEILVNQEAMQQQTEEQRRVTQNNGDLGTERLFSGFRGKTIDNLDVLAHCSFSHRYFEEGNTLEFAADYPYRAYAYMSLSTIITIRTNRNPCVEWSWFHELGHWIDFKNRSGSRWWSDNEDWQKAFREESHILSECCSDTSNYNTSYEFFAEFHAYYHVDPEFCKERMPLSYALMSNFC